MTVLFYTVAPVALFGVLCIIEAVWDMFIW